jgi:outer membrane receptor protein involved in Fe transport
MWKGVGNPGSEIRRAVAIALATAALTAFNPAVLHAQAADTAPTEGQKSEAAAANEDVTSLSTIQVVEDPLRAISNEPSASSFGFSKPMLETPRTVSFVSEEQISLFGISAVEDLTRAVPGTYTTTRYGLQGGINVRGVSADIYYRGMKRLNMQGHVRTVLSAMDGIEVVKGPPSPIYGMGKIGGYTNLIPKASRAKTGAYLPDSKGFLQGTTGSYNRSEAQLGVGGPLRAFDKQGGYYGFFLLEDSDSFVKQVGIQQRFFQGTTSIENAIGPFRAEFGGQLQQSITSGAYMNRVTQDLIDNGNYITGSPLVNLDLNGDGRIGYLEMYRASPVRGNISAGNQALNQRFTWPVDGRGNLVDPSQFPKVPGVPAQMLAYLNAHPEIDCRAAQVMRAMPAGGPLPQSNQLPVGMVLDPCTVGTTKVDYRGNGSFEREQNAKQALGYFDLVYDINPDFTVKNQLFYDSIDSFKDSWLPYGENQYMRTVEDKVTVTKRIPDSWLPEWVRANSLASVNYRKTYGWIRSSGGDYDWRQDVMLNNGEHYPNTMFWQQYTNDSYATGLPATRYRKSKFDESGVGAMLDIDLFKNTNIIAGLRYDRSNAYAQDFQPFNDQTGQSPGNNACATAVQGCPGRFIAPSPLVRGTDSGKSWSVSLSQQLPFGLRPYATYAKSSLMLDGSNNIIAPNIIPVGHIGEAELKEVGLKASFFGGKLQWTTAGYEQTRSDVTSPDDPSESAEVTSTETRGVETELKWVPNRNIFISAYATWMKAEYVVDAAATIGLDARQLGFMDVLDPVTGEVLYPAEAFFYGGKATVQLPAGASAFSKRVTNPDKQYGLNSTFTLPWGFGLVAGATYFSETYADRTKLILLPDALVANIGVTWDRANWHIKANGYNVNDEVYWRARSGDTSPGLASAMPGVRWEITLKHDF